MTVRRLFNLKVLVPLTLRPCGKGFLTLLLVSLGVSPATAQRAKSVLLSSDEAKKLAKQCSRPSPVDFSDTWTPTMDQIKSMERKLKNISKLKVEDCCIEGASISDPNDWYMQYAALVWKGRRIIYISGISRELPEKGPCFDKDFIVTDLNCDRWKYHAEIVCDGGTQWGVIFNVESGKFSNLSINGIA